mgnify:CR=1 FL=1
MSSVVVVPFLLSVIACLMIATVLNMQAIHCYGETGRMVKECSSSSKLVVRGSVIKVS